VEGREGEHLDLSLCVGRERNQKVMNYGF
jgi:hypothetical protein